jgi:transcriptional regulator with GAF, ATPase, and Fis domain
LKEYDDYVEELKYSDDDLEEFNDTDDVIFNNDNITLSDYHLSIPKNGITIDQVMKDLIVETLKLTKGNQLKAAKILGLSRAKLRYRIEQLKIDLKQFN